MVIQPPIAAVRQPLPHIPRIYCHFPMPFHPPMMLCARVQSRSCHVIKREPPPCSPAASQCDRRISTADHMRVPCSQLARIVVRQYLSCMPHTASTAASRALMHVMPLFTTHSASLQFDRVQLPTHTIESVASYSVGFCATTPRCSNLPPARRSARRSAR